MAREMAERFAEALQESERTRDPGPVTALFADDAEATSITSRHAGRGRDGIRKFWKQYLDNFDDVASEFTSVLAGDGGASLEWVSRGRLRDGRPLEYRGVSVIEVRDGQISRFRTYYDSAVFVPTGPRLATSR